MFPSVRLTIQNTNVFSEPSPDSKKLVVVRKGVQLSISEGKTVQIGHSEYLFGKTPAGWAMLQRDFDDFIELPRCPICFDSNFTDEDKAVWCCGKQVHIECLANQVKAGHSGKLIGFNHVKCPCCTRPMTDYVHQLPTIHGLRAAVREVQDLRAKIKYLTEEKERDLKEEEKGGWAFFNCSACEKPFCGGKVSCAEEEDLDTKELTCPECQWQLSAKDHRCFKHGRQYAIYKCDSCCAPASWSCTSNHYCERCHNQAGAKKFYPCPGAGKCMLGIPHPCNIMANHMAQRTISFVIGCEKCDLGDSAVAYEYESCADAFEAPKDNVFSVFNYGPRPKEPVCPIAPKKKEDIRAPPPPQPVGIPAPPPPQPVAIPAPAAPVAFEEEEEESSACAPLDFFFGTDSECESDEESSVAPVDLFGDSECDSEECSDDDGCDRDKIGTWLFSLVALYFVYMVKYASVSLVALEFVYMVINYVSVNASKTLIKMLDVFKVHPEDVDDDLKGYHLFEDSCGEEDSELEKPANEIIDLRNFDGFEIFKQNDEEALDVDLQGGFLFETLSDTSEVVDPEDDVFAKRPLDVPFGLLAPLPMRKAGS